MITIMRGRPLIHITEEKKMWREIAKDITKMIIETLIGIPIALGLTILMMWGLTKADHLVNKSTTKES